ncbi:unnamed protein product, partial [Iphiclides podalirius]
MRATVSAMEKARIEYRAALSWMKSASAQLDPDTGRGLDNFRKAQRQVRESKKIFDKLTLDVLQKIDLLAAARCNMFSHVLSTYQNSFSNFSTKAAQTFLATIDTMSTAPQYEFCILKSLQEGEDVNQEISKDKDQMLFFQDDYKDEVPDVEKDNTKNKTGNDTTSIEAKGEPPTSEELINTSIFEQHPGCSEIQNITSDLAGIRLDCDDLPANFGSFMPSQLLQVAPTTTFFDGGIRA